MAFREPNFTELTNGQQQFVQISCTEFHASWTMNAENAERNSLTPLSAV
jgi:hypothetical protein